MMKNQKRIGIYMLFAVAGMLGISATYAVEAQAVPFDSMTAITTQISTNLANPAVPAQVQQENINQAEHLLYGRPVILQTNNVTNTITISQEYDTMMTTINTALDACVTGGCTDPTVAANAKNLLDTNYNMMEIKGNLEIQTADVNCNATQPATTCPLLAQGDEPQGPGTFTTVGTDKIWTGFYREIRSPFFQHAQFTTPQENIIVPSAIANGECSVVVKEIQGIKSIVRPIQIPIWQEPWTSRAQIIGFNTVWVIDFIPAEFVKSLKYCNVNGSVVFDYDINVIVERELTHFWKFLDKGM